MTRTPSPAGRQRPRRLLERPELELLMLLDDDDPEVLRSPAREDMELRPRELEDEWDLWDVGALYPLDIERLGSDGTELRACVARD